MQLTEEQRDIQRMVRNYAQEKIAPLAKEIDETGRFPAEAIQGLADMGIMGLNIPEEYGGAGMDEILSSSAARKNRSGSSCRLRPKGVWEPLP